MTTEGDLNGYFDGIRMHRLLTNLLLNAAQHGAKNQPVTMLAKGSADEFTIEVNNQGPAIPEEAQGRIFRPLVQLHPDDAGSKPPTSMGLGLFIACEVARAHGGGIRVHSSDAEGTTFTVYLPRQRH